MVSYAEPVFVNHDELWLASVCMLCWASGCESWGAMLSQWVWIMMCYAERMAMLSYSKPVVVMWNIVCYDEPVIVNHWLLCWASDCESCCFMLSQWLWIMVCYTEPADVKQCALCWASGSETLCVMLSHWIWIIVCYSQPVTVNHGVLCRASCRESR